MSKNSDIGCNNIEYIEDRINTNHKFEIYDPKTHILIPRPSEVLKKGIIPNAVELKSDKVPVNLFYQIVYPDDLNLKPAPAALKPRGRPKKIKVVGDPPPSSQKSKIKVVSRTRSGRTVKFPKHIENEFKKIEINDDQITNTNEEVKVTDFVQYTEKPQENINKDPEVQHVGLQQKKRKIAAQYRCPKCNKAYLGRNKILEHLRKNPLHGPLQEYEQKNFDVWNYLVGVTQKTPVSERGRKFCQEISNLLSNVLLLSNSLFKKLGNVINEVVVDKVLGNAIGLNPGSYFFDDTNLCRDVTVLKLISNNDFLSSLKDTSDEDQPKPTQNNCQCGKITKNSESMSGKSALYAKTSNHEQTNTPFQRTCFDVSIQTNSTMDTYGIQHKISEDHFNNTDIKTHSHSNFFENNHETYSKFVIGKTFQQANLYSTSTPDNFAPPDFGLTADFSALTRINMCPSDKVNSKTDLKIQSDILITPDHSKLFEKDFGKMTINKDSVNSDILSDTSVLATMQSIQHTGDDFMLPVSTESSNILDNSSSSDEVMNVDQFVNERFKKMTEPELDVTNSNSLNLELPNLDIFQFHPS